jgi:UDP-2,3-diacylglucosamine hydrolase
MKISAISDVHIKSPFDEADQLLQLFLDHQMVQSSQMVFLLGDIFDLMVGPHEEYFTMYAHLFQKIDHLISHGVQVFYVEGNHDLHLRKLFHSKWSGHQFVISQNPIIKTIDDKKYYFSHGDEHEVDNVTYQRYIKTLRTLPFRFLAEHVLSFSLLNYFGKKASEKSRKRGAKYFNSEQVRNRFRSGLIKKTSGEYDFVIGGHSHVKDEYNYLNGRGVYLNNGFALNTKSFIYIENHNHQFISLV